MRLIDADELLTHEVTIHVEEVGYSHRSIDPYWVETAPTIEAELRKHGRWEAIWHSIFKAYLPTCSECGGISPIKYKYCPYCGRRMSERREDAL